MALFVFCTFLQTILGLVGRHFASSSRWQITQQLHSEQFGIVLHSSLDTCFDVLGRSSPRSEKTSDAQLEMHRIWNKTRKWTQCSTWIVRLLQKFPNKIVKYIYHDVAAGVAASSRSCSKCLTTIPTYSYKLAWFQKMIELFNKGCP